MPNHDRALGAYIGAAIGDAMGGPVEGRHAVYIRRVVGEITGLLPYRKPYTRKDPHPGYTVRTDAGSVTDDTFIRGDFTRFYLDTQPPRTPEMVVEWMLEHADFSMWWAADDRGHEAHSARRSAGRRRRADLLPGRRHRLLDADWHFVRRAA